MTHDISILMDYLFFLMIKSIFLNSKLFLKIIKPINRLNKKYHLIYTISNLTFIHVHSSREILQFYFIFKEII